jgi:hypothetical protein
MSFSLMFHFQKNGQHGESWLLAGNPDPTGICAVSATCRALERFWRIVKLDPTISPDRTLLLVCWEPNWNSTRLVCSSDIKKNMRQLAAAAHHLDSVKDVKALRRWGTHSLCTGAAVVLHSMTSSECCNFGPPPSWCASTTLPLWHSARPMCFIGPTLQTPLSLTGYIPSPSCDLVLALWALFLFTSAWVLHPIAQFQLLPPLFQFFSDMRLLAIFR